MEKINFNFVKGDSYSRGFTVDNCPLSITQIYFTVKEKSSDRNYVIQKRLNNGISKDQDITGRYVLTIDPSDTDDLKVNTNYVFDIEIIAGSFKKTIIGGNLRLDDWDITSRKNEV
jgi:hypothetical protein